MPDSNHDHPQASIDQMLNPIKQGQVFAFCTRATVLLCCLWTHILFAAFPDVSFKASRIEFQSSVLDSVHGRWTGDGHLEISANLLSVAILDKTVRALELECPVLITENLWCKDGHWRLELSNLHSDRSFSQVLGTITGVSISPDTVGLSGKLRTDGLKADLLLLSGEDGVRTEVGWQGQSLTALQGLSLAPEELMWISRGNSQGSLVVTWSDAGEAEIQYSLELDDLSFDSPEGQMAGESLQLESRGTVYVGATTSASVHGRIISGELLLGDFYRSFSDAPLDFAAQPTLIETILSINEIDASDHSALKLEGSAQLDLDDPENTLVFRINRLDLNFPGAYKRYFETIAGVWTLDGLDLAGSVTWSGDWIDGAFQSGEFKLSDLTVVDNKRHRFAVTGLDATMRPGDHDFESRLSWRGLLLGPINLGAGDITLDSEPGTFALSKPLELHFLGGRNTFYELGLVFPEQIAGAGEDLDIKLRAELTGMDMEQLTTALDWPVFSGDLNGVIPGVKLDKGVFSVDGEIIIEVFDGRISVSDLNIERLFGVLPSLAANVDVYDLDLEQLTRTFSFGQISGRLDGYIHDLRLLDWRPVAFDAWFGTPERQAKSTGISRQAVNHLTTIGGGGATAALTGPIMKMFNNFSYRRLGLGCRLQNNVCDVRGISEDDVSVLIMEGAGLPKIMIRAFNRSLDWPQLLAGLTAASGDESIRVGD